MRDRVRVNFSQYAEEFHVRENVLPKRERRMNEEKKGRERVRRGKFHHVM